MEIGLGLGLTCLRGGDSGIYADPALAKLLLNFDADFHDRSFSSAAPTLYNSADVSSVEKVFGDKSFLCGPTKGVSYPGTADWNMGDAIPSQLSMRVWRDPAAVAGEVLASTQQWPSTGWLLSLDGTTKIRIVSQSLTKATWTYTIPTSQWVALRFNHDGAGNFRMYADGVLISTYAGALFTDDPAKPLYIGIRDSLDYGWTGHIDVVLFEKGSSLSITTSATYSVEESAYSIVDVTKKLLLHLNTDFSDSALGNKTPSTSGAPLIDTGEKVFGAASMGKTVDDDYVSFPSNHHWDIGDGVPWQLSFRAFNATGRAGAEGMFSTMDSSFGVGWYLYTSDSNTELILASNGVVQATWSYTWPVDTWVAHRVNYDGAGNWRWYVNGVLLAVKTGVTIVNLGDQLIVGNRRVGTSTGFTGNLDEILWEKGSDLVVTTGSAYTVETAPWIDP